MTDNSPLLQPFPSKQKPQNQSLQNDNQLQIEKGPTNFRKYNTGNLALEQIKIIKKIKPSGQTLINDIVIDCFKQMIRVCGLLKKKDQGQKFKIFYIAVFDGVDTLSKSKKQQANSAILDLHKLCSQDNIEIQSYFMGINLNKSDTVSLRNLFNSRSLNFKNVNAKPQQILQCIESIKKSIFQQKDIKKLICFNLDTSASMLGCRWHNVCLGVQQICKKLTKKDLFRIVVKQNFYVNGKLYMPAVQPVVTEKEVMKVNISSKKKKQSEKIVQYKAPQDTKSCWKKQHPKKKNSPAKICFPIIIVVIIAVIAIVVSNSVSNSNSNTYTDTDTDTNTNTNTNSSTTYRKSSSYSSYQTPTPNYNNNDDDDDFVPDFFE